MEGIVVPRVIHFEIHAENPGRAIAFYKKVLGWEFSKWPGPVDYWIITTGPDSQPGINGGLVPRRGVIDGTAVIAYVFPRDRVLEPTEIRGEKLTHVNFAFANVVGAIGITTLVLISGFLIMMLSHYRMMSEMGLMCGMIIAIALMCDFFLTPGLLMKFDRPASKLTGG